jgi:regulation of enolase protein 1 (concanavalin A-like superfamily)
MEFFNDHVNHSTSSTLDTTDWSLSPLAPGSEKTGVWFCFRLCGDRYECFYSYDGTKWVRTRSGKFAARPMLYVGITCACPLGDAFRVTFDSYQCTTV